VLAAADAYRTLVEGRPHRPALSTDEAAQLAAGRGQVREPRRRGPGGRVAGGRGRGGTRPARPSGLTRRQVEVLRLMADGLSNRDIARPAGDLARTARAPRQDVYAKIGATSRAAAALYGMEHGPARQTG
jgi:DNA-binding NarL/FixJ family response regulator